MREYRVQILTPLSSFPCPRRIIITVLDEEVDTQPDPFGLFVHDTASGSEQNVQTEGGAWSPHSTRIPNLHAGLIHMSDDFDDPLPDSFWWVTKRAQGMMGLLHEIIDRHPYFSLVSSL